MITFLVSVRLQTGNVMMRVGDMQGFTCLKSRVALATRSIRGSGAAAPVGKFSNAALKIDIGASTPRVCWPMKSMAVLVFCATTCPLPRSRSHVFALPAHDHKTPALQSSSRQHAQAIEHINDPGVCQQPTIVRTERRRPVPLALAGAHEDRPCRGSGRYRWPNAKFTKIGNSPRRKIRTGDNGIPACGMILPVTVATMP